MRNKKRSVEMIALSGAVPFHTPRRVRAGGRAADGGARSLNRVRDCFPTATKTYNPNNMYHRRHLSRARHAAGNRGAA